MSIPTFSLRSSTDAGDTRCTAVYGLGNRTIKLDFPSATEAFHMNEIMQRAYTEGLKDGRRNLAAEITGMLSEDLEP